MTGHGTQAPSSSLGRDRRLLFAASLYLLAAATAVQATESPSRPNIIVILTDDQGYQDLGCFGSTRIRTPHIDRMAEEGLKLTSFYAQAVCGPSRAALLTGCYPIRVGEPQNRKHQHTILHTRETTFAELVKAAGYRTACIGKWHLGRQLEGGWDPATMPNAQGFDEFFGTPLYNGFTVHVRDTGFRSPLLRNTTVEVPAVESWDSITAQYTQEACQFIRANSQRPFLLYLAHNMPHIPLGAGPDFAGKSEYGPYGDAIEEIDWSTGQILKCLQEEGLDRNTLVVLTSDNGPWIETTRGNVPGGKPLIPRDHSGTADPLRGYKMVTWEGGLRVPCVVRWPGVIPAGTESAEVATTMDLLPTICELAGAPLDPARKIDGVSLVKLLTNPETADSPRDAFFYYSYTHLQAVRSGRWKLVLPRPEFPRWTGFSGRFAGDGVPQVELYDMHANPEESRDVAAMHPEIVAQLMRLVEAARAELGDYNRVGSGARFFDDDPRRPEVRDLNRPATKPRTAVKYDKQPPVGDLRFDFESGQLDGWKIVSGEFGNPVTDRAGLPNHAGQPFNKQGRYLIFTGQRDGQSRGDDSFVGTIESPRILLKSGRISFLVGGGQSNGTCVVLMTADGRELQRAHGTNGPELVRVNWNLPEAAGQRVFLRIVDTQKSGWGHVTFDDFSCDGVLVEPESLKSRR